MQRHGWILLFHECIVEQLWKLHAAAERAQRSDPQGFESNANVKLFRALSQLILETVIEKPRVINRMPVSQEIAELANQFVKKNQQAASSYFKQLLAQFSTKDLKIKTHISIGENAIAVLHDLAEESNADLVLLAAHGETGDRRWPYGSVTTSFIAYGNTSILIMQDLPPGEIHPTPAERAIMESKGH